MVSKDMMVAIAGIVILVVAMVGIFSWEGEYAPSEGEKEKTYLIRWGESRGAMPAEEKWTGDGEPTTITKSINEKNLTMVEFELSWEDDHPGLIFSYLDNLKMKITSPSGKVYSKNDTSGSIEITAYLGEKPEDTEIKGSMDDVNSTLENYTSENGIGEWKIEISVDAKPHFLWFGDKGNDWKLEVSYSYYEVSMVQPMSS